MGDPLGVDNGWYPAATSPAEKLPELICHPTMWTFHAASSSCFASAVVVGLGLVATTGGLKVLPQLHVFACVGLFSPHVHRFSPRPAITAPPRLYK